MEKRNMYKSVIRQYKLKIGIIAWKVRLIMKDKD